MGKVNLARSDSTNAIITNNNYFYVRVTNKLLTLRSIVLQKFSFFCMMFICYNNYFLVL